MTTEEMIAVMEAYHRGEDIQFWNGKWVTIKKPAWDFASHDYRIKPAERKPREWYVAVNNLNKVWASVSGTQAKCEWEGDRCEVVHVREVLPE